jgi:DNA-binding NarL/FixJ family response regulator
MVKGFKKLFARLGLRREEKTRSFMLDENLRSAVKNLAEQKRRPVEEVQAELLATVLAHGETQQELLKCWEILSPREKQITALTCLGYTNRQIAAKLDVSKDTVKGYVRQALVKFHLHSKNELRIRLGDWDFSKCGPGAQT